MTAVRLGRSNEAVLPASAEFGDGRHVDDAVTQTSGELGQVLFDELFVFVDRRPGEYDTTSGRDVSVNVLAEKGVGLRHARVGFEASLRQAALFRSSSTASHCTLLTFWCCCTHYGSILSRTRAGVPMTKLMPSSSSSRCFDVAITATCEYVL